MKILVIGDSCTDVFVYGQIDRLCPEAPVPTFQPVSQKENGGMARNVKNNLVALGADVHIISNDNGMKKVRYVDTNSNQMIMRLDENDVCGRIENLRDMSFSDYDAIVISDYDKGFLHVDDIQYICEKYEDVFIDTKKEIDDWIMNVKYIKINSIEYNNNVKYIKRNDNHQNKIQSYREKNLSKPLIEDEPMDVEPIDELFKSNIQDPSFKEKEISDIEDPW